MVGAMRHLLTLETRTETLDSLGDAVLTYTELATAWGSVEAVSSRERVESAQVQAEVSHRITIRSDPAYSGLAAKDRITLGSRIFDIVTPMDRDGRGRHLEITALERS